MGFAFWRPKKRAGHAAAKAASRTPPNPDDDDNARDPAATLRARARHRLIGAAALLLAVAIVVPMVLDPEPRPVAENIPIDIPSERTAFTPRLSLPPVPAPESAPMVPPADQAPAADAAAKADAKADVKSPVTKTKGPDERKDEEARLSEPLEAKAGDATGAPAAVKGGKFALQAAAPANEKSARELSERLKKSGFTAFTEKVETKDGARFRVRVGPYATREDAERVRARLKALGVSANLVAL